MASAARPDGINDCNPYLHGLYAPQLQEFTALDLPVIGELPKDLHGAYVRNGPNPAAWPCAPHHWFDGDGMVHSVYFENGHAEYRNRYVRTEDHVADLNGGCGAGGVLMPAARDRGERGYKDTANTDLVMHGGSLLALWYIAGVPVRIDARTLETIRSERFGGALPRHVSAHSKVDPVTGELVFFDYALYEPWMSFGTVSRDNVLTHFATVDLPGPRLPHDMGLTENYVILHDLPVVFTDAALRDRQWRIRTEPRGARFGIVPRTGTGDQVRWFETDPCYVYHVANAWEDGDEVVMHACRMVPNGFTPNPDYGPFGAMVNVLALHAVPVEWRFHLKTGAVRQRQLDDRLGEFPVVSQSYTGRRSRWSYNVSMAPEELQRFDGLLKYDLETGDCIAHPFAPGDAGSEAAFAPRLGGTQEDDGYVVSFVTDPDGRSEVQVIAAQAFADAPIARIPLPGRVPAGFHATWAPGEAIR